MGTPALLTITAAVVLAPLLLVSGRVCTDTKTTSCSICPANWLQSCGDGYRDKHQVFSCALGGFFPGCQLKCTKEYCCSGWTGTLASGCPTPICKTGCTHGSCNNPGECNCHEGWTGSLCTQCIKRSGCGDKGYCSIPGECLCEEGWTGEFCTKAECASGCQQGTCAQPGQCDCLPGYSGPLCDKPVCEKGCQNGACVEPDTCKCLAGWSGADCSVALASPGCVHGTSGGLPFGCVCEPGWSGELCTTPVCSQGCSNGGTCVGPDTCSCTKGWQGPSCSECQTLEGCQNGFCVGPLECRCQPGYQHQFGSPTGTCNTPVCLPGCHLEHGYCDVPGECKCKPGYQGTLCNKPVCASGCDPNHGSCDEPGECNCDAGYQNGNALCDAAICREGCEFGSCQQPGACVCTNPQEYTGLLCNQPVCSQGCINGKCSAPGVCQCDDGWQGVSCEKPVCAAGCATSSCQTPGDCDCAEIPFSGPLCNEPICAAGCALSKGGFCSEPGVCECKPGWQGSNCDVAICESCDPDHGTCVAPDTCECQAGWTGDACKQAVCAQGCHPTQGSCSEPDTCTCVDPTAWAGPLCTQAVCQAGCDPIHGSCKDAPGKCFCEPGWQGTLCNQPVCAAGCNLQHGGCSVPGACECFSGWEGATCDVAVCLAGCKNGDCDNQPGVCNCFEGDQGPLWKGRLCNEAVCARGCKHGTCEGNPGGCQCNSGWTGVNCSQPICRSQCNLDHASCTLPGECLCKPGWQGFLCDMDVDECLVNQGGCASTATCVNTPGSFECRCKSGYQQIGPGTDLAHCVDIDECAAADKGGCTPGLAKCINTEGSRTCECAPGYRGSGVGPSGCLDVDECESDPCHADAQCTNTAGSFTCACKSGFEGDGLRCQPANECIKAPCSDNSFGCCDTSVDVASGGVIPSFTGVAHQDFGQAALLFDFPYPDVVFSPTVPDAKLRTSGFDVKSVFFTYDPASDTAFFGVDCGANICGDADGDGDPGLTGVKIAGDDAPHYDQGEHFALVIIPDDGGLKPVAFGMPLGKGLDTFGTYNVLNQPLSLAHVLLTDPEPCCPATLFAYQSNVHNSSQLGPNRLEPDLEFSVASFSQLVETAGTSTSLRADLDLRFSFKIQLFHGSSNDIEISEDLVRGRVCAVDSGGAPGSSTTANSRIKCLPCKPGYSGDGEKCEPTGTVEFGVAPFTVIDLRPGLPVTLAVRSFADGDAKVQVSVPQAPGSARIAVQPTEVVLAPHGEANVTLSLVVADTEPQPEQNVQVMLTNPSGAAKLGASSSITARLEAVNAPGGVVTFRDDALGPFAEEVGVVTMAVLRTPPLFYSPSDVATKLPRVSIDFNTSCCAATGTIHFEQGEVFATANLTVLDNTVPEPAKTIMVSLMPTSGVTLGLDRQLQIGVLPSDSAFGSFEMVQQEVELAEGGQVAVQVRRAGGSLGEVSVQCKLRLQNAAADDVRLIGPQLLIWREGDTSTKSCTVFATDDTVPELAETAFVVLALPTGGATISEELNATAVKVPASDAPFGSVGFSQALASVEEGQVFELVLTRTGGTFGEVSVEYTMAGSSHALSSFGAGASGTITFKPGETAATARIRYRDDNEPEPQTSVTITLSQVTGGAELDSARAQQTVVVTDLSDNPSGVFAFASSEPAGNFAQRPGDKISVTIVRRAGLIGSAEVVISEQSRQGWLRLPTTVAFATNEDSKQVEVEVTASNVSKPTVVAVMEISTSTAGAQVDGAKNTATVLLEATSSSGVFAIASSSRLLRASAGDVVKVAVQRSGGSSASAVVTYAIRTQDVNGPVSYLDVTQGTLEFPPGVSQATAEIQIQSVNQSVLARTIHVELLNATLQTGNEEQQQPRVGSLARATVEIGPEGDPYGVFEFAPDNVQTVAESVGTFDVLVARTGTSGTFGSVLVLVEATALDGATTNEITVPSAILFAPGQRQAWITVTVKDDEDPEHAADFQIRLKYASIKDIGAAAPIGPQSTLRITVQANDGVFGTFQLQATGNRNEGIVRRSGGMRGNVRVALVVAGNTVPIEMTVEGAATVTLAANASTWLVFSPGERSILFFMSLLGGSRSRRAIADAQQSVSVSLEGCQLYDDASKSWVASPGCSVLSDRNSGLELQLAPSPCLANPCLNGGSCVVQSATTPQCLCTPGFTGRDCGSVDRSTGDDGGSDSSSLLWLLVIPIVLAALLVLYYLRRRTTKSPPLEVAVPVGGGGVRVNLRDEDDEIITECANPIFVDSKKVKDGWHESGRFADDDELYPVDSSLYAKTEGTTSHYDGPSSAVTAKATTAGPVSNPTYHVLDDYKGTDGKESSVV